MPTIPTGLKPVVEGYSIGSPDGVMRGEVGGGMPRYAREWDRGVQPFRVTMVLDAVKFSVWTVFFHHVVKKGSIAFDMDLDSGFGVMTHSVNIMPGTYGAVPTGGNEVWTVSFMVEAESAAYGMTAADAQALIDLHEEFGGGLQSLLNAIDLFANQHTMVIEA